jgi:hypothetical protein
MTSSPEMPAPIWNSISLRNAASSNASALVKGVTSAVVMPLGVYVIAFSSLGAGQFDPLRESTDQSSDKAR